MRPDRGDASSMESDHAATTAFPIEPLLAQRWSPRAFAARPVTRATLGSLFEAARWAPSCYNEQPWRFVFAQKADEEAFARLGSCLVDANRWALAAPVLMLSVAKTTFTRNDKPNRHAWHDVGLAAENLVVQAQALGLAVHQMAGFDVAKAREVLAIPSGFEPVAMVALGYPGDPDQLSDELRQREQAPRTRNALDEMAFEAKFGSGADFGQ